MKKVGLFFGSFDPVHIGHVATVQHVLNEGLVDSVLVIVSLHNPFKEHSPAIMSRRLEMVRHDMAPLGDKVKVSEIESSLYILKGHSQVYTYDVLKYIKDRKEALKLDEEYHIIMTPGEYTTVPSWYKGKELLENHFLLVDRKGSYEVWDSCKDKYDIIKITDNSGHDFEFTSGPEINVSSSQIREDYRNGKMIYPYVSENTLKLIKTYNLYEELSNKD